MMDLLHAMDRQMELMSPFSVYHFIKDPSLKNAGDVLYMPTLAYVGARGTVALLGETWPGFWAMRAHGFDLLKQQAKTLVVTAKDIARTSARASPYVIGGAMMFATARGIETGKYEQTPAGVIVKPVVDRYMSRTKRDTGYGLFEFKR